MVVTVRGVWHAGLERSNVTRLLRSGGEVLDLLENETGMHSCFGIQAQDRRLAPAAEASP
jgi:hypothetical protein